MGRVITYIVITTLPCHLAWYSVTINKHSIKRHTKNLIGKQETNKVGQVLLFSSRVTVVFMVISGPDKNDTATPG